MIKAVVFDFDGVILESASIKTEAFSEVVKDYPENERKAFIDYHMTHMGISRNLKFRYFLECILGEPSNPVKEEQLSKRFSEIVYNKVLACPYVPGAKEFLELYCNKLDLFIASGTPQGELLEIVKKRKLDVFFRYIYGAPVSKEEAIQKVIEECKLSQEEILFVGDAATDLKAAMNQKVYFAGRATRDNQGIFKNVKYVIDSIDEISEVIREIGNKRMTDKSEENLNKSYIDISFPIFAEMAIYPGNPEYTCKRVLSIDNGDACNVSSISMGTHTGTHVDAPLHIIPEKESVEDIPLEWINGKATVIEVPDIESDISLQFIEGIFRTRETHKILLFKTKNSKEFLGKRVLENYTTLSYESAAFLTGKGIHMVGIDYMTIERPRGRREEGKSVHKILMNDGITILESIDLRHVVEGSYDLHCMPLKIEGADGSPVRAVLEKVGNSYR